MKPRLIAAFLALFSTIASAKGPHPGREPYTPSKQEWLLVEVGPCFLGAGGSSVANVSAADDPETITIELVYRLGTVSRDVDDLYKLAKQTIEGAATKHGWLKWVKIERRDLPQDENLNAKFTCAQVP